MSPHPRLVLTAALVAVGFAATSAVTAVPRERVPHVVAYSQTLGFRHLSIDVAKEELRSLSHDGRFTIEFSEDPADLSPGRLAKTDVVLWLSNTAAADRSSPFSDAQEKAYTSWMSCGGAHVGVHAAVDSYSDEAFPAFVEANGAIFAGHPLTATSIADDQTHGHEGWGEPEHEVLVRDQGSPMTSPWRGEQSFTISEELYQLDRDPAEVVTDYRPLLVHGALNDPQAQVTGKAYPGDYADEAPIAWTGSYRGKNRTFYTNLGHSVLAWSNGRFQRHLVNGILWSAQKRPSADCLARAGFSGTRR
jgi:type 1 glutamine amidotransferase